MKKPARIRVPLETHSVTDLWVGEGAVRVLLERLRSRPEARRVALFSDGTVFALYGGSLAEALRACGLSVQPVVWAGGEKSKTRETKQACEDEMLRAGLGRDTLAIALGGGVVTDVAGFVAATYARGIPWIAIPTTVVGMADAAIGGKTGVNTPFGKNLVGAFHAPRSVHVDPEFLRTLPDGEVRQGLAEIVKTAAVRSAADFSAIERDAPALVRRRAGALGRAVIAAARGKARVVAADPREEGLRRVLNFGHTIGHAIESASGHGISHGEAVAVGMVAEARWGEREGITDPGTAARIESLLRILRLPVRLPAGIAPARLIPFLRLDKKARAGTPALVVPSRVGRAAEARGEWVTPAGTGRLLRVLEELVAL